MASHQVFPSPKSTEKVCGAHRVTLGRFPQERGERFPRQISNSLSSFPKRGPHPVLRASSASKADPELPSQVSKFQVRPHPWRRKGRAPLPGAV